MDDVSEYQFIGGEFDESMNTANEIYKSEKRHRRVVNTARTFRDKYGMSSLEASRRAVREEYGEDEETFDLRVDAVERDLGHHQRRRALA